MRQHWDTEADIDVVAVARVYLTVLNSGGRNYQAYIKGGIGPATRKRPTLRLARTFLRDKEASRIGLGLKP